ncbi:hypothetical protein Mlute_01591 [Meiothermus luteus]|uniref:Uncharacterized protein n=1 Tax=Meiothermus luteus TaxID=2026184 RepID=A0A399EN87_9DEIN|nr:hypothetical protein [Meiothermus luteus]RIH85345.1 hypothetical protein Mlute_01591 [Meiothermus luteus]RMH53306.1 MAG: hypothetical protein D6684_12780 [Deinococcota bacterium]
MDHGLYLLRVRCDERGQLLIELKGPEVVRFSDWNALGRYVEEALRAEKVRKPKKGRSQGLR